MKSVPSTYTPREKKRVSEKKKKNSTFFLTEWGGREPEMGKERKILKLLTKKGRFVSKRCIQGGGGDATSHPLAGRKKRFFSVVSEKEQQKKKGGSEFCL